MNPIKPQDLRIGNFITDWSGRLINVTGIHQTYLTAKAEHSTIKKISYDLVQPIPLTEEVLVKCGFEYDGVNRLWKEPIYLIQFPDGYLFLANQRHVNLYYLHHLQNLYYALTGEELIYKP